MGSNIKTHEIALSQPSVVIAEGSPRLIGDVRPNIELLRGLKSQEINFILSAAKSRRVPAKSVMTFQDEPADHLLLLWKGRARYFETPSGKKLIMIWITPGHAFGGAAL